MIDLTRFVQADDRTIGRLVYDGQTYWTIERPWLGNEPYVSCIPDGVYGMARYDSPTFGKGTWEIVKVPDRTFILIHVANYSDNVQGCIGLGMGVFPDLSGVSSSKRAITRFYEQTRDLDRLDICITTRVLK